MKTIHLRMIALAFLCLFAVPSMSFAQTDNNTAPAPPPKPPDNDAPAPPAPAAISLQDLGFPVDSNPRKRPGSGQTQQAVAHAQDSSAARFDHDRSLDRHALHVGPRRRQEHQFHWPGPCMRLWALVTAGLYFTTAYFSISCATSAGNQ